MSSNVDVLQDGYSRWLVKNSSMIANGTATIIRATGGKTILVDTLGPWDRERLTRLLADRHLSPDDVDLLICTHLHSDHVGNLNLFTAAPQVIGDQLSRGEDRFEFDIFRSRSSLCAEPKGGQMIDLFPNVQLYSTPGHTANCCSVVVRNVDRLGTVAIVGDLFESQLDLDDENVWLEAGSVEPEIQRQNRKLILSLADYIVPGHGPMFKVESRYRKSFAI